MKTLASSLLLLTIASFATAADSVALKDIAGDYYFGDGLGVNCSLTVTAKGKFTFQWNGCLGTYDKNEGTASIKEGVLLSAGGETQPAVGESNPAILR